MKRICLTLFLKSLQSFTALAQTPLATVTGLATDPTKAALNGEPANWNAGFPLDVLIATDSVI
ncbi:MAG TPA: hypothetical protein VKV15_20555 [Bryobacteraceae bacterium]|nr:hypothetical protein [Bryobacteraceae bacterium]